jgi:hypothetical protein
MQFAARLSAARPLSFRPSWPLLLGCALFLGLLARPELLADGDTYWHVTIGQWMLDHRALPLVDRYSHTANGGLWTPHEWLSEVLFAWAYARGGWALVVGLAAGACAAAMAMLLRYLLRFLEPVYAIGFTVLAASLLAPHLLARPHVLILPILVAWGIGLLNARDENRAPSPWMALLMVPWANLHGSFVFGLALIGPFALDAVLSHRTDWRNILRGWGIFLVAGLAGALATPMGTDGIRFAFQVDGMAYSLSQIGEWRSADFQRLQPLELGLLAVAAGVFSRGLRLSWLRIGLLLLLLHLALKHVRHADLLAVLGPLLLAQPIGAQWRSKNGDVPASLLDRMFFSLARPATPLAIIVAGLVVLAGVVAAVQADKMRPSQSVTPRDALHAAQSAHVAGNVLNAYQFGGYLIYSGIPTFIDGRTDLFGDAFMWRYQVAIQSASSGALETLLERHQIGWTLLPPSAPAVAVLDHLPGWRRIYTDAIAVVHARN